MNRNQIVYIHGGSREEGGYSLWCLSGYNFSVIRYMLNIALQVRVVDKNTWLWKVRKWDRKHMKDHHIYLGSVAHKRFFDANFKELF